MGRGLHLLCPVVASCFNVAGEPPLSRSWTGRSGGGGVGVERVPLCADNLLVGSHILICPRGILLTRPEAPSPLPPTRSGIWENLFLASSLVRPSSHFHPVESLLYCWEICREGLLPAKSLPSNQGLFHSRWKRVSGTSAAAGARLLLSGFCLEPSACPCLPLSQSLIFAAVEVGCGRVSTSLFLRLSVSHLNFTWLVSLKAEILLNFFWGSVPASSLGGSKPYNLKGRMVGLD